MLAMTFASADTPEAFFEKEVKPILTAHCLKCHGAEAKIKGGLNLLHRDEIVKGGDSGPGQMVPNVAQEEHFERRCGVRDRAEDEENGCEERAEHEWTSFRSYGISGRSRSRLADDFAKKCYIPSATASVTFNTAAAMAPCCFVPSARSI